MHSMNKIIRLGNIVGLKVISQLTAVTGFLLLWLILSLIGWLGLDFGVGTAVFAAFLATILHFLGELWHQLGHAWAARRTGYPISGVMFVWVLATSLYPRDEPELPAHIHIWRALGGPAASFFMALVGGTLAILTQQFGIVIWYLALFIFLDNLLVFTLGALLPLGFTDGSTLLHYWPQRHEDGNFML
jgi:hypothetical protein